MMERDALERLALDRAGGELDPDTEALLAAYLADHPEDHAAAAAIEAAYRQCRDAIAGRTHRARAAQGLPAASATGSAPASPRPAAGRARRWLAHAAALLLAVGLGAGGGWWAAREGSGRMPSPPPRPALARGAETSLDALGPFWHKKVATLLQGRPAAPPPRRGPSSAGSWFRSRFLDKEDGR